MGYKGSIMLTNSIIWLSFVPVMVMFISWIIGNTGLLFVPLVYENYFSIPAWLLGILCTLPGIYAMYIANDARRVTVLNIWVGMIAFFAILIIGAGIYWTVFISENVDIMSGVFEELAKSTGKQAEDWGLKVDKVPKAYGRAAHRVVSLGNAVAMYEIYRVLTYPYNAVFFLHWQRGVTAITLCVIPSILAIWAFYQALGTRNYFATKPALYKNQMIADGPLWEEEYEGRRHTDSESDHSFDSEEDYDTRHEDREVQKPLTRRSIEYAEPAPVDVVRVNANTAQVVQGGRIY